MKISAEKKKQVLLDSFDLLKSNYHENSRALRDIVKKMIKIDIDIAISMWKYLIRENPDVLHDDDSFAFSIMYPLEEAIGIKRLAYLVVDDNFLKMSIYGECGDLRYEPFEIITYFIEIGKLDVADELLKLAKSNPHDSHSLYDILDQVIPEKKAKMSVEAFDFITSWIETVPSKEERAKLNLRMLDFMDEDEEDDE